MRITSLVNEDSNCRLQCYVDDPALTVGGSLAERNKVMLRTIIIWLIMGLKLAWSKGHRGDHGEWVVAYFRPWADGGSPGVISWHYRRPRQATGREVPKTFSHDGESATCRD